MTAVPAARSALIEALAKLLRADLERGSLEALTTRLLTDLERPTDSRGDAASNVTGDRQLDGPAP